MEVVGEWPQCSRPVRVERTYSTYNFLSPPASHRCFPFHAPQARQSPPLVRPCSSVPPVGYEVVQPAMTPPTVLGSAGRTAPSFPRACLLHQFKLNNNAIVELQSQVHSLHVCYLPYSSKGQCTKAPRFAQGKQPTRRKKLSHTNEFMLHEAQKLFRRFPTFTRHRSSRGRSSYWPDRSG